jgi:hypothetical protein
MKQEKMNKIQWNREQAMDVIEGLEPVMSELGAHVGLTGSILYKGQSEKDLDLIIYPHNKSEIDWNIGVLKMELIKFFKMPLNDCGGFSQIRDSKEVSWLKMKDGRRIDFFFLS